MWARQKMKTGKASMVVTRNILADVPVFDGEFEHGAIAELTDVSALQFLPGSLADGDGNFEHGAAGGDLFVSDQNIDAAGVEIDANLVAGLEDRQVAADGGFGAGVQDRRAGGGTALTAVAQRWQDINAALDEVIGREHVDDFGGARVADGTDAADDEDAVFIDAEGGIVDALVVVFGAFEDDGPAGENVRREEAFFELSADEEVLTRALSKRFPLTTRKPAFSLTGLVSGRMTVVSRLRLPA